MDQQRASVVVIGGGASAVYVAVALRERAAARGLPVPRTTVVGRDARVGRGVAYGQALPHHRLNSPAGKMSVSAEEPDGFLAWTAAQGASVEPGDFVPRVLFGDYLEQTFRALVETGDAEFVHGEATDIEVQADGARVSVESEDGPREIRADVAVLALGNPPPVTWTTNAPVQIDDPWAPGALDDVPRGGRVLLVGTGLTMVDVATSLGRRDGDTTMTATSRHLLLPNVHPATVAEPGPGLAAGVERLGDLAHDLGEQVRSAAAEHRPWQGIIDGMRPRLMEHWVGLTERERRRFVEHLARRWDVHRHRMAQSVWAELRGLIDSGRLQFSAKADPQSYDAVVFCTGPASIARSGWSTLVDRMLERGTVVPEPLGLGIDADHDGSVRDAAGASSGRVLAVGHALRGALWETTAIGEIRIIANRVADRALDVVHDAAEVSSLR